PTQTSAAAHIVPPPLPPPPAPPPAAQHAFLPQLPPPPPITRPPPQRATRPIFCAFCTPRLRDLLDHSGEDELKPPKVPPPSTRTSSSIRPTHPRGASKNRRLAHPPQA